MMPSPKELGLHMPAEWARHRAVWMAFPYLDDEWRGHVRAAQREHAALVAAIALRGGERVELLVAAGEPMERARKLLDGVSNVNLHTAAYGDAWTRDTAPIGLVGPRGVRAALRFRFNGWGGKFAMPGDDTIGDELVGRWGLATHRYEEVLEGGSIDVDGDGTLLTTEQCLFEPNRNPDLSREETSRLLEGAFGVSKVLYLRRGLVNDHTDGHVDTIARFVGPGRVVAMEPREEDDPHRDALLEILEDLGDMEDARGRALDVVRIPSPGLLVDHEGEIVPASYCNFYIANEAVIVPTYGVATDDEAVRAIGACFPDRAAIGVPSRILITGGGSFHCMTQQEPEAVA